SAAKFAHEDFRIAIYAIDLGGTGFFQFEGNQAGFIGRSFAGRAADREPAGKYLVAEVLDGVIPHEIQAGKQVLVSFELADGRKFEGALVDVVEAEHPFFQLMS